MSVTEIHVEAVGLFTFGLHQIPVGLLFIEGPQHNVVRQEVRIVDRCDTADMKGIRPDGVLADVRFEGRYDDVVVKGNLFTFLCKSIGAVHILQGKNVVRPWRDAFDNKMAAAVGTGDTEQRRFEEKRIFVEHRRCCRLKGIGYGMESDEDALDGFQVPGFEHIARNFKCIDSVPRRERVGIVSQWITLVIVGDSIREVDGVSGIGFQRVLQFYKDAFTARLDFRLFQLGRGDDDIIIGVINLDKLIEKNLDLIGIYIDSLVFRLSPDDFRRCLIKPATVGISHLGTGRDNVNDDDNED